MALQYVGGITGIAAGSTSNWTVSLTALTGGIASSAAIGDVVVVFGASGYAAGSSVYGIGNVNAEYSQGSVGTGSTSFTNIQFSYKRLTTADTTVTLNGSLDTKAAAAVVVQVWRGVATAVVLDVSETYASGSATGRPNPPSITPTTTGAVILAAGAGASATGAVFTNSELTSFLSATSPDTTDAMVGAGYKTWTSGAFDPAQFAGGTTGAGDAWAAVTVALRPYALASISFPANPVALSVSGVANSMVVKPFKLAAGIAGLSYAGYAASFLKAFEPVLALDPTPTSNQALGTSVAVSENGVTMLVMEAANTTMHVFRRAPGTFAWSYETSFYLGTAFASYGVSGDGATLFYTDTSAIYVYKRISGAWTSKPISTQAAIASLSYDGNRICLTTGFTGSYNYIKVYNYSGSAWTDSGVSLLGSYATLSGQFGRRLTITHGGTRIFCTEVASLPNSYPRFYEFTYGGGSWTETAAIELDSNSNAAYTLKVARNGGMLAYTLVASGDIDYFYYKRYSGGTWQSTQSTVSEIGTVDMYGQPLVWLITANSDKLIVASSAAYTTDVSTGTANTGAAYEYDWNGSTLVYNGVRYSPGVAYPGMAFAKSISAACEGKLLAGGMIWHSQPGYSSSGAVLVYSRRFPVDISQTAFSVAGYATNLFVAQSGYFLALSGGSFSASGQAAALVKTTAANKQIAAGPLDVAWVGHSINSNDTRIGQLKIAFAAADLVVMRLAAGPKSLASSFPNSRLYKEAPDLSTVCVDAGIASLNVFNVHLSDDGTRLFCQAPRDNDTPPVLIYTISGTTLTLEATLNDPVPTNAIAYGEFGRNKMAVSADGAHLLIAAKWEAHATTHYGIGAVYYYSRSGSNWTFRQKIQPVALNSSQLSANFGESLAISDSGTVAVVGSPYLFDGINYGGGAVWVLRRSGYTWTWSVADSSYVGYAAMGFFADISADGETIAYHSARRNSIYSDFRIRKYNGATWPQVADIQHTTDTLSLALSGDGSVVLKIDMANLTAFSNASGSWSLRQVTPSIQEALSVNGIGSVISSADLHYVSSFSGFSFHHFSSKSPAEAIYGRSSEGPFTSYAEQYAHGSASANGGLLVWAVDVTNTASLYTLFWRKRVATIRVICEPPHISVIGLPAAIGRRFTLLPATVAKAFSTTAMYKGKGLAIFGPAFTLAPAAASLRYNRVANCVSSGFGTSFPIPFFLREKGRVSGVPYNAAILGSAATIVRKIRLSADVASLSVQYQAANIAKVFRIFAIPRSFSVSGKLTSNALTTFLAELPFSYQGHPTKVTRKLMVSALPCAYSLGVSRIAGRLPNKPGRISVSSTHDDAVIVKTEEAAVYV